MSNSYYSYVDNFAITMVPESATATWSLAALVLTGFAARLRNGRRVAR